MLGVFDKLDEQAFVFLPEKQLPGSRILKLEKSLCYRLKKSLS